MSYKGDRTISILNRPHTNEQVSFKDVIEAHICLTKGAGLNGVEADASIMQEIHNDVVDGHEVDWTLGHRLQVGDG